jgi:hypothetical protein
MRAESYALSSVAEDLEYLRDAWREGTTEADLRRGSAILRRLLIDNGQGVLIQIWRELGFERQPVVVAPSLSRAVLAANNKIVLATAGRASVDGIDIAGYLRATEAFDDDYSPDGHEQLLADYVSAPCIVVYGHRISRGELVKYFSNYLGGVHLSWRARKKQDDYARLFRRIDELPVQSELLGKDLLHFELLSIGQVIGQSSDCMRLVAAIKTRNH